MAGFGGIPSPLVGSQVNARPPRRGIAARSGQRTQCLATGSRSAACAGIRGQPPLFGRKRVAHIGAVPGARVRRRPAPELRASRACLGYRFRAGRRTVAVLGAARPGWPEREPPAGEAVLHVDRCRAPAGPTHRRCRLPGGRRRWDRAGPSRRRRTRRSPPHTQLDFASLLSSDSFRSLSWLDDRRARKCASPHRTDHFRPSPPSNWATGKPCESSSST
jgi:hypothetical protein